MDISDTSNVNSAMNSPYGSDDEESAESPYWMMSNVKTALEKCSNFNDVITLKM